MPLSLSITLPMTLYVVRAGQCSVKKVCVCASVCACVCVSPSLTNESTIHIPLPLSGSDRRSSLPSQCGAPGRTAAMRLPDEQMNIKEAAES